MRVWASDIETLATNASVLTAVGRREAIAVFCNDDEPFEAPASRFDSTSPVSRALALANRENLDWVVLTRASEIRLYAARSEIGVGRKGRAETFVELNLALLSNEQAGYLQLLFSADALADGGSLHKILDDSADYAAELAVRLRDRIYHETVPALSQAVAARLSASGRHRELTEADLDDAYEQVMVILFRLLFVAYAEDKDLLPYRSNGHYADHSLSHKARRLAEDLRRGKTDFDEHATDLWDDVCRLWEAVNLGNADWGVPTYNGGLFSDDPAVSPSGAALAGVRLTNAEFGPALTAALVDKGPEGPGSVDFRSLSVREFGTIYEGLLESKLSAAPDDLTVKRIKGIDQYVPASGRDEVEVPRGTVYFHNRSGARKATGSYFTKPFAVEHLLDHALEPALEGHLARLDSLRETGDDAGVAQAFFDFRCADIAMGSAHFLVAAVDRIEARLSAWLSLHPAPAITAELARLRTAGFDALGELGDGVEIETGSLLRRQVARHCIYGVDKNRVAVELARLAIWVHTFVPGLPLSFLDHNLVYGDSLTGVAAVEDAALAVRPKGNKAQPSLFIHLFESMLEDCLEPLARLGRLNDADKAEIQAAREAHTATREAVRPIDDIFDVATAVRAGAIEIQKDFDFTLEKIASLARDPDVRQAVERLAPVHYPTAWPEVFSRAERAGFDCLLGNPPWEKVVVDREVWWGTHLPRVRSLPVARRRARIDALEAERPDLAVEFETERARAEALKLVIRAAFPHLGSGQTDLYKAFAWANLTLCRAGGRIGIVLPRSAVSDAGMANWRSRIVARGGGGGGPAISVATVINHKGWVFDGVHNSYTVALAAIAPSSPSPPASTQRSGLSTLWTAGTRSLSSRSTTAALAPNLGGRFEVDPDATQVAVYPGPARSLAHFRELVDGKPELVPVAEFNRWSSTAAFPQIPSRPAFKAWRRIKMHARFDGADLPDTPPPPPPRAPMEVPAGPGRSQRHDPPTSIPQRRRPWSFRPVAELHATHDRHQFVNDDGASARSESSTPPVDRAKLHERRRSGCAHRSSELQ